MNEQPDPPPEGEDHDWVRDLLAEAGSEHERAPDWVNRRIASTLEELAAEPARPALLEDPEDPEDPEVAEVTVMTPRRQRRWGVALLAAAAITVGGYSLGATGVLGGVTGGEADSASTGAGTTQGQADAAAEAGEPDAGAAVLSSQSLRVDARDLARDLSLRPEAPLEAPLDALSAEPGSDAGAAGTDSTGAATRELPDCEPPPAAVRGTREAVRFDGEPATATVRRLDASRTRVQVWSCAGDAKVAQVTVRP